jgi:hypothetical protein
MQLPGSHQPWQVQYLCYAAWSFTDRYNITVSGQNRSETSIPSAAMRPFSLQERTEAHYTIGSWGLAWYP